MALRELTHPVDLVLDDRRLNPAALGFSRQPLHRTDLPGWGRNKRWEYWGIVTPTHVVGLTLSSLDYVAVHQLYVFDRTTGRERNIAPLVPLARNVVLPDVLPPVHAHARAGSLSLDFRDEVGGTRLRAQAPGIDLDLFSAEAGDVLGVVVPWSQYRFQYTVKSVARPVRGTITLDRIVHQVPDTGAWAVLDRGRGKWPYRITWNWGAGSGLVDGRRIGLQLGGKWTAGTGSSECALFVDGQLHYLGEEPEWTYDLSQPMKPWRVRGQRVDATLTPFHVREARSNVLVVASTTYQAFGTWTGWMMDDAGQRVLVDGLVGWAEEARNRW